MKNYFICILFLALAFGGCQSKVQHLDVKQVSFSDTTDDWGIRVNLSVFSSTDPEVNKSCQVLNDEIQKYVSGLSDSLKLQATEFFTTYVTDTTPRPAWNYELIVEDSVFMATDHFVSVRVLAYVFTGGAHGNTSFCSFNYDVKNQKLLTPEEIINYNDLAGINALLKANFKNPEKCFNVDPTLDLMTVLNFNPTDVCFTYEQYVLGAYACGVAEITVPRKELKDAMLVK